MALHRLFFITLASLLLVASSCKKDNENPDTPGNSFDDYDREAMLENYAANYILPAYTLYRNRCSDLYQKSQNFAANTNQNNLDSLRESWLHALLVWQDVAFLEFGPSANISLRSQTNLFPADTSLIKDNISSGNYTLSFPWNFDAKGFQAIDYLIYGLDDDDGIMEYFTTEEHAHLYLQEICQELKTHASDVLAIWENEYALEFVANSSSNAQGSSVSNLVNALNLHYEAFIRKGKIGLPAGVFNGFSQEPMPGHVEALYYGQSLPFLYRSIESFNAFLKGESYVNMENGNGFDDYLKFVDAKSNGEDMEVWLNAQMNLLLAEIETLNDPFSQEVINNNAAVTDVYEEFQKIVPTLKVEMTDALGVLIEYQDSDGD